MESWRHVWREGFVPSLTTAELIALRDALRVDDPRLTQGSTTTPPPLMCVEDWPVEAACALGFCGWQGDELKTVGEVERFFADVTPFDFALTGESTFPNGLRYLVPEPGSTFSRLTHGLHRLFPEYPPYGGQFDLVVPHLTIPDGAPAPPAPLQLRAHEATLLHYDSEAVTKIEGIKERAKNVGVVGGREFNPGWHLALDLRNMLLVSEAIAKAALLRQESRGGHTRDDYPGMDAEWRKTLLVCTESGGDVNIERQDQIPMRPDLLELFEVDELKKYLTSAELPGAENAGGAN